MIFAPRSKGNFVAKEFSIGRCPIVLPEFYSITFAAKNLKGLSFSCKQSKVNILFNSDIPRTVEWYSKILHAMSKNVAFFLIRSRKKEIKAFLKQTPFLILLCWWNILNIFLSLMFIKHMSQKQRKHLFNFIFVCSNMIV